MKRPLSTKTHARIDYLWSLAMPVLPWLIGAGPAAKTVMRAASGLGAAETALTSFEGGVKGVLPMQGHLALDAVMGVGLVGAGAMLKKESPMVRAFLVGAGLFAIAAALSTQPIPRGSGRAHAKQTAKRIKAHTGWWGRAADEE